jgi:hypothetical protein
MLRKSSRLLAARYGGSGENVYQSNPLHMHVNKPLNTNDVDLSTDEPQQSRPLSQQTDMSYFLQRIRLSEISRNIVDQINSDPSNRRANIMAMDRQLVEMMNEVPAFLLLNGYQDTNGCTNSNHHGSNIHVLSCRMSPISASVTSYRDNTSTFSKPLRAPPPATSSRSVQYLRCHYHSTYGCLSQQAK